MLSLNQKLAIKQQVAQSGMQTIKLEVPKAKALELYRAYKTHRAYQKPEDYEIMRTYQLIAQGHVVIQAIESIRLAGLNEEGLPKLALGRADQKECHVRVYGHGGAEFKPRQWMAAYAPRQKTILPVNFFPRSQSIHDGHALLPIIPVHLRPRRGLANYYVLWEAEWKKLPPGDPYLLRQIGKGDMWLVVAAWDLTDVERAAMRTRINAA